MINGWAATLSGEDGQALLQCLCITIYPSMIGGQRAKRVSKLTAHSEIITLIELRISTWSIQTKNAAIGLFELLCTSLFA